MFKKNKVSNEVVKMEKEELMDSEILKDFKPERISPLVYMGEGGVIDSPDLLYSYPLNVQGYRNAKIFNNYDKLFAQLTINDLGILDGISRAITTENIVSFIKCECEQNILSSINFGHAAEYTTIIPVKEAIVDGIRNDIGLEAILSSYFASNADYSAFSDSPENMLRSLNFTNNIGSMMLNHIINIACTSAQRAITDTLLAYEVPNVTRFMDKLCSDFDSLNHIKKELPSSLPTAASTIISGIICDDIIRASKLSIAPTISNIMNSLSNTLYFMYRDMKRELEENEN